MDGLPLAKNIPVGVWSTYNDNLLDICADYSIFDYPHCRRVVLASCLLSVDLEILSFKIRQLHVLEELIVKVDYISPLPVNNKLFFMRVLQAIGLLQQWHPNLVIVILVEVDEIDKIKAISVQLKRAD